MAVTSENNTWENVSPSIEQTQENFFSEWAGIERKFGEFGAPGYSEQTITVRNFAAIFGHSDPVDVRFTLYRGEDGLLLCIHGCYLENGIQKPFVYSVHPDHQRQGIGTTVAQYIIARYEQEFGKPFSYTDSWQNVTYTLPSANFVNKYTANVLSQTTENE